MPTSANRLLLSAVLIVTALLPRSQPIWGQGYDYDDDDNAPADNAPASERPFSELPDLGNSWRESSWFGLLNDGFYLWIFHLEHGWLFVVHGDEDDDFFFYDLNWGDWWYATSEIFPAVYSVSRDSWVFYFMDTAGPRRFVDLASGEFFEVQ